MKNVLPRRSPSTLDCAARPCLTQVDLADRWHLSPRTLERWRWRNQGPAYLRAGGRVLYRREDIEAYEAAQLRGGDR